MATIVIDYYVIMTTFPKAQPVHKVYQHILWICVTYNYWYIDSND